MSKSKNILKSFESRNLYQEEVKQKYEKILKKYIPERFNEEDEAEANKSEQQKTHERYLRNIKRRENGADLEVKPAKKMIQKPGTYFYGNLKKLAEDFGDIDTMFRYMTMGQLNKYIERDGKIYNCKTDTMVYDPVTGEINE